MKLRYYHLFDCLLLVILLFALFFLFDFFYVGVNDIKSLSNSLFPIAILMFACLTDIIIFKSRLKIAKDKGKKKLGYIVDSFYIRRHITTSKIIPYKKCAFKCVVDNDIKDIIGIYGISDDDAYNYVCTELNKIKEIKNNNIEIKRFPIDIYVYKNKYYYDLNSVNLNTKNL